MAQDSSNKGPFEQIGEAMGGTVGKMVGRANDMAMNAAGTIFGTALQTLGGWWATPDANRASSSISDREDQAFRQHYESRPRAQGSATTRDYDSARPPYQFGYVAGQNPDYQTKPFDSVEADLERAWESLGRERFGDWPEVRDQVSYGYTYRASGAPNPS